MTYIHTLVGASQNPSDPMRGNLRQRGRVDGTTEGVRSTVTHVVVHDHHDVGSILRRDDATGWELVGKWWIFVGFIGFQVKPTYPQKKLDIG